MKRKLMKAKQLLLSAVVAFTALGAGQGVAGPVKPCSTSTVAFVKSIKGEPANVLLARAGDEAQLSAFAPLCQGDVLTLKTGAETVVLGIAGSPGPKEVAGPTTYTVGGAVTGAEAVSEVIQDRLLPLGDRTVGQGLGRASDPFEFGLLDLETESARIKAGNRPLWVGWYGGYAPFELTVTGPSGAPVASQPVSGQNILLPASDISPGRYTISVKDANGRTRETSFEAVTDVPPVATVDAPAWMGADSEAMLVAFCVAAEDPYTWSFEAAQQLASAPDAGLDRQTALALIGSGDVAALCPGTKG